MKNVTLKVTMLIINIISVTKSYIMYNINSNIIINKELKDYAKITLGYGLNKA